MTADASDAQSAGETTEGVEGDVDQADDVPFSGDWAYIDGGEITEGAFMWPCSTNADCLSGFCVQGPDGKFCTRQCLEEQDCPPDFQCVGIVLTYPDLTFLCVQKVGKLCSPCSADEDCILDGARCVSLKDGSYCGQGCAESDCPLGYECQAVDGGEDQCVPESGTCSCIGDDPNVIRSCSVTWKDPNDPDGLSYTCSGVQHCEAGGWGPCNLAAEECDGLDNDCNGVADDGFLDPVTGKYATDANCGVCGNNCTFMLVEHGSGKCDADKAVPDCTTVCDSGFFDVDGNSANGCECQFLGDVDFPGETAGKCDASECFDSNCDGIDGEVAAGVFVAKYGSDSNAGTIDSPLLTIQAGIDKAAAEPDKRDVYVSTGVYVNPVVLKAGIGVYGGYSADFATREPVSYETVVLGGAPSEQFRGAVNAQGITDADPGSTVFSGFVVFGYNNKTPGGNSYGIYVRDCDASLAIDDCRVVGGDGGDGMDGQPGAPGDDGVDGVPGAQAQDIGHKNCKGSDHNQGGAGGSLTCGGNDVSGGAGGTAICPNFDESPPDDPKCALNSGTQLSLQSESGESGKGGGGAGGSPGKDALISGYLSNVFGCVNNASDGNCGTCRVPGESMSGVDGSPGAKGGQGEAGVGSDSATGKVVDGEWFAAGGGNGGEGEDGSGGGGGGAAGGVETVGCDSSDRKFTDIGGSGGGGGSGGCGATGGTGGGSGGGSFAVFLVFTWQPTSVPSITNSVIEPGRGGDGGSGGNGGVGGSGGDGASGGTDAASDDAAFCTSGGGHGGAGGSGGHGGGGGGGSGGPAFGLYVHGADATLTGAYEDSGLSYVGTGEGGAGGTGGASIGNDGGAGSQGIAGETNF